MRCRSIVRACNLNRWTAKGQFSAPKMELATMVSENRSAADVLSPDHALALVVARAAI
jgi:hypothetical protein